MVSIFIRIICIFSKLSRIAPFQSGMSKPAISPTIPIPISEIIVNNNVMQTYLRTSLINTIDNQLFGNMKVPAIFK